MNEKYVFNPQISIYDNEVEVCLYWPHNANGTVLRGLTAGLFRELVKITRGTSFEREIIFEAEHIDDADTLNRFVDELINREVIISVGKASLEAASNDYDKTILILGKAEYSDELVGLLTKFGFSNLKVESELSSPANQRIQSQGVSIIGDFEESLSKVDLIVFVDDSLDLEKTRTLNKISVENKIPFLSLRILPEFLELGPLVLPGKCACFECYWTRLQSNTVTATPSWILGKVQQKKSPIFDTTTRIGLNILAVECSRFVSSNEVPLSLGHIVKYNVTELKSSISPVIEVPGCQYCAIGSGSVESGV